MGKVGSSTAGKIPTSTVGSRPIKKKEEIKGFMANDRPSSANNEEAKKTKPMNMIGIGREEMMVTGSSSSAGTAGKRRFPSSNSKQDPLSRFK